MTRRHESTTAPQGSITPKETTIQEIVFNKKNTIARVSIRIFSQLSAVKSRIDETKETKERERELVVKKTHHLSFSRPLRERERERKEVLYHCRSP